MKNYRLYPILRVNICIQPQIQDLVERVSSGEVGGEDFMKALTALIHQGEEVQRQVDLFNKEKENS